MCIAPMLKMSVTVVFCEIHADSQKTSCKVHEDKFL